MNLHVLVIVGPTASGKTRLGVEVAHRLGSEIVSADSRQVYRGLDIGTGKDLEEYARVDPPVPYHLIDIADPEEVYTLFRYQEDCYRVLGDLAERAPFAGGEVPLLMVGGSGLYVEAVVRGYRLADVPMDREARAALEQLPPAELVERLQREAPEIAETTDLSISRRVIRGLEIAAYSKLSPVRYSAPPAAPRRWTVVGVTGERGELRTRIGRRLRQRLEEGMIDEVRQLLDRGVSRRRLDELGLEYREVAAFLEGEKDLDGMISDLESAIGRFAKRQQTWFRGMERRGVPIQWMTADDVEAVVAAAFSSPPEVG
ncbi:MAG: tRNA (adenosine(37)-N6)-dimethylallyltransferase MiaA [Acidobacteriota bacterium]|nr:tRNA (adenosine(37)-N6)-dimethylallyltransferase MiaA [Acidobacteriota bacterium]